MPIPDRPGKVRSLLYTLKGDSLTGIIDSCVIKLTKHLISTSTVYANTELPYPSLRCHQPPLMEISLIWELPRRELRKVKTPGPDGPSHPSQISSPLQPEKCKQKLACLSHVPSPPTVDLRSLHSPVILPDRHIPSPLYSQT